MNRDDAKDDRREREASISDDMPDEGCANANAKGKGILDRT